MSSSSSSPGHPAGRGALTCVDTRTFHLVALPHPIPIPKRADIRPGSLRCDLLVPQLPSVGESMKRVRKKKGSPRTVHICANQLCFVATVFLPAQSDEIRRHKCPTFPAPSMIQDLHPEDTQGTGRAGCTQDSSDHSLEKLAVPNETATTPYPRTLKPWVLSLVLSQIKIVQRMSFLPCGGGSQTCRILRLYI